ncbi:MAG: hypothetical protein AAGF84_03890 [Planctomycetota bacterium]
MRDLAPGLTTDQDRDLRDASRELVRDTVAPDAHPIGRITVDSRVRVQLARQRYFQEDPTCPN